MKTNPQSKSFRLANSPAVVKLALMELVQTDQEIDDDVRASIKHALTSDPSGRTLSRVKVFVDLTEFEHIQRNAGEQKWDYAALQYCISRQAHFPMLQALFKTVTRRHVQVIRNELAKCAHPLEKVKRAITPKNNPRSHEELRRNCCCSEIT